MTVPVHVKPVKSVKHVKPLSVTVKPWWQNSGRKNYNKRALRSEFLIWSLRSENEPQVVPP